MILTNVITHKINNINIKEEYNKEHSKSASKLSGFSPIRKKRRIFLEEKKKLV